MSPRAVRLLALLAAVGALAGGVRWATAVPPRPRIPGYNVVYLSADSFNKRHLEIYGYDRPTMPFLSELAKEGVVFDRMINPSGWTNENLVSIFTSLSSPVHKVETRMRSIDPAWITPIEVLRDYGYRAPRLEYWRADKNHADVGFEEVTAMPPSEWIEAHGREAPFFLFYQFLQPHLPYNGDAVETATVRTFLRPEMIRSAASRRRLEATVLRQSVIPNDGRLRFAPEDAEPMRALYDGELLLADREFRKVVETLDRLGLRDSTIIVVGADHGEELMEHGFVGHGSTSHEVRLYDEIVNPPFLIVFPRALPRGSRVARQVRGVDVMPTLLDLLGVPVPEGLSGVWEGRSMLPVIRGEETEERIAFVQSSRAGYQEKDPQNVTDRVRAVLAGGWKLIHYAFRDDPARFELFDLAADTGETRNLVDAEPARANELKRLLLEWTFREGKVRPPPAERFERRAPLERWREALAAWWRPRRTDFTGVASPPEPLSPRDGDVITAATENGKAVIRWTGEADVPYVVEYEVGEGDYRLVGTIETLGNEKTFGPFPRKYWDTYLTLYNPFRARVSIDKEPREWSPWITFAVRPAPPSPPPSLPPSLEGS